MGAPLNLDDVQHEKVRRLVDLKFRALVDALEDAYYGTADVRGRRAADGWRHGVSHPWRGFDVQATPAESKAQFDELHGLLWRAYEIVFHAANDALPVGERLTIDDATEDDAGRPTTKRALAKATMAALRTQRAGTFAAIEQAVRDQGLDFDIDK